MVEIGNRLLEDVLRRSMGAEHEWNKVLERSTQALAHRVISYLGITPAGILLGRKPSLATVDDRPFNVMVDDIPTSVDRIQRPVVHVAAVRAYIQHRAQTYDYISETRSERQRSMAERYNKGVRQVTFKAGDLVMLHQKDGASWTLAGEVLLSCQVTVSMECHTRSNRSTAARSPALSMATI